MKILLTGADGQVGWELRAALNECGTVVAMNRTQLDLSQPAHIRAVVREHKPQIIVNAAAYTAVDRAETEPELARSINADAVSVIAEEARRQGALIIHYSTDYVFDGRKLTPYLPDDPPNPQSVYGATKLEGERALLASGASCLVLRTAWVYSVRGRNFLLAIVRNAASKPELRVVNDQTGTPTSARMIARHTAKIINHLANSSALNQRALDARGSNRIFHLTCSGQTTWFEFARQIIDRAPLEKKPPVIAITTSEYPTRAVRPAYSILDCSATDAAFQLQRESWIDALGETLKGASIAEMLQT